MMRHGANAYKMSVRFSVLLPMLNFLWTYDVHARPLLSNGVKEVLDVSINSIKKALRRPLFYLTAESLQEAVRENNPEIVRLFLEHNAQIPTSIDQVYFAKKLSLSYKKKRTYIKRMIKDAQQDILPHERERYTFLLGTRDPNSPVFNLPKPILGYLCTYLGR